MILIMSIFSFPVNFKVNVDAKKSKFANKTYLFGCDFGVKLINLV